jgi:hypothetical protein
MEDRFNKNVHDGMWIHKPALFSCGRGIKLVKNLKIYKQELFKIKFENLKAG